MYSINEMRDYMATYDGYKLQGYLLENIDLIGYIAAFYLVFVGKGKSILRWLCGRRESASGAKKAHPYATASLNRFFMMSCLYHSVAAALAFLCATNLVPTLMRTLEKKALFTTLCAWDDALIYTGPMGFWVSACVLVKIFDLTDSCLLVVRDYMTSEMSPAVQNYVRSMRQMTAAHWWFRGLIAIFFWHTFSIGISTFPALAAVDATCHFVIHATHLLADLLSFVPASVNKVQGNGKASVSLVHKLLNLTSTVALLAECIACTAIAVYSSYMNYTAAEGCRVVQANVRMCVTLFVCTIGLAVARLGSAKTAAREAESHEKVSTKTNGTTPSKSKKSQ